MAINDTKTWIGSTGPYLSDSSQAVSGLQTDKTPIQDFDVIRSIDLRKLGNPVVIPSGKTYYVNTNYQLIIGNQIGIQGILEISGELIVDNIPDIINAVEIINTPAGNIVATNVQAAINELDTEKAPLDSPVFATQITTPKIVTASGGLSIIPATKIVTIGDGAIANTAMIVIDGGTNAAKGAGVSLKKGGNQFFALYDEAAVTGSGTSNVPCFFAETGLGQKWMVNGSAIAAMALSSAGVLSCTSSVFTTQITTPIITTASGGIAITPNSQIVAVAGNIMFYEGNRTLYTDSSDGADNRYLALAGGGAAMSGRGSYIYLQGNENVSNPGKLILSAGNVATGDIVFRTGVDDPKMILSYAGRLSLGNFDATATLHLKAGTATASTAPLKLTSGSLNTTAEAGAVEFLTDVFYATITTGAARKTFAFLESPSFTTPALGTPSAGVLTNCSGTAASLTAGNATQVGGFTPSQSPGANNVLVYNASGVLAAGTVPLARMMRAEYQASASSTLVDLNLGTVVTGDRILFTGVGSAASGLAVLTWNQSAGGASIDFAGATQLSGPGVNGTNGTLSGVCRVTSGGTLTLRFNCQTGVIPNTYGHAMIFRND